MCSILYGLSTIRMPDGKESMIHLDEPSDALSQWCYLQGTGCLHASPLHTNIQSTLHPALVIVLSGLNVPRSAGRHRLRTR